MKLLFCIDMLNEGVHIDDISGVILLRPTAFPIIYKQQIGRALACGKKKGSVIFDIVLNIENLYSIDAVEEEMQVATTYYRSIGCADEIVNEHFKVIDELRDCRELFEKLNDTLGASWDLMYEVAKKYYQENGNLDVPKRYVTPEGYTLGSWLATQRLVHEGKVRGKLNDKQIGRLNNLGMLWGNKQDIVWQKNYVAVCAYKRKNGHLNIPVAYETADGLRIGR